MSRPPAAAMRTGRSPIDAGLRAHMIRVYNYMASAVALTGVVAWLTFQVAGGDAIIVSGGTITGLTPLGQFLFGGPLMWVLMLAPLALVLVLSFGINRLQPARRVLLFFVYAGAARRVARDDLHRLYRRTRSRACSSSRRRRSAR